MSVFPTALIKHIVHPTSQRLEIWVRWNDRVDGRNDDMLGAWIDTHGALVVQTNDDPMCVRQIFLPPDAWDALHSNPNAELVLCGPEHVIDVRDFTLGVVIA